MVGSQGANSTALFLLVGVFALLLLSYPVESFAAKGGNGGGNGGGGGNNPAFTTTLSISPTSENSYQFKQGTTITITATFNQNVEDSPVPEISISGANTLAASDMTKSSSTVYTYSYTVGAGNGEATISISDATTSATTSALSISGQNTFSVDNTTSISNVSITSPTTDTTPRLTFTAEKGNTVTVTSSGATTGNVGSTTVSCGGNSNTCNETIDLSTLNVGTNNLTITSTDKAGNTATASTSVVVQAANNGGGGGGGGGGGDTTSPKADITYSQSGPYRAGVTFTITATFDENLKDATIPKIAFSGVTDTTPVEMTKVSASVYTFDYTVDFNRTVTVSISLSGATDNSDNEIQSAPNSGGTFDVLKKSSSKKSTPPKLSSSSITSTGGADGGFGGILQSSEYDKGIVKTGNTVSLRFDLDENFGDYYTFVLYLGELNNKESMGLDHSLQVIYHNGQYTISDKEQLFSNVNVIETEFDGKTILFFDIETDKAFGDMDVGITAWNKHNQMVRELNQNVFSISPIVKPAEPGSFELLGTLSDEYVSGVYDAKTDLAKDFEPFLFVNGISTDFVFDESDLKQSLDTLYQKWNSKEISDLELIQLKFELISQKKAFVNDDEQIILLENMQEWQTEFLYDYVSENPLNSQALLSESFEIISQMI